MSPYPSHLRAHHREKGIVLPVALIMLLVLTFAGLMAARKSSTYEQVSNNLRTNQVARQAAERGLRYCEKAVIEQVTGETTAFGTVIKDKVFTAELADDQASTLEGGEWNTISNWAKDATNLVEIDDADDKSPTCIIQAMSSNRYLITARGLSGDAVTDAGELTSGSEVWLQSILTPLGSIADANGGVD